MIASMAIQLTFTPEIQAVLNYERYYHPVPLVRRRMEVLWLKSLALPHVLIALLAGVCENTMREYFALYQAGGIERLKEVRFYQPESELQAHASTLETHFRDNPPATVKEAMSEIEALTGLKRGETQVRQFLKKLGLRCRKVGMIPAKADPDEQATYLKEQIEPRLAEAQAGKRAVFFVDAAHFVLVSLVGLKCTGSIHPK